MSGRDKCIKEQLEMLRNIGFEILSVENARGAHKRIRCRYASVEFVRTVTSSANARGRGGRWLKNFEAENRRIANAIDTGNKTILDQYIGKHR